MPVMHHSINLFLCLLLSEFRILHSLPAVAPWAKAGALFSGPRVGFVINLLQPLHRDVRVNLGRG